MMRAAAAALLALTIVLVYAGTVSGLVRQWTSSPDASYGVVLLVVSLALLWSRRAALARAAAASSSVIGGLLVLIAGLAIFVVGQLGADVFLTRISLVVVAAGALWFTSGRAVVRTAAAPLVFLLIAIPPPELVVNAVTLPLQLTASRIAEQTLTAAGVAVFRDGNVLQLPSGSLEVAEACSGLRSAVSLAAIAVLLAWAQPTWPRRAAMIMASVPVAILMNGLRITGTALASEAWGPETATGSWHTFSGWLAFVGSVVLLIALHRAMAGRSAPAPPLPTQVVNA